MISNEQKHPTSDGLCTIGDVQNVLFDTYVLLRRPYCGGHEKIAGNINKLKEGKTTHINAISTCAER